MRLRPERQVACVPFRCAFWVVQFDQSRLHAVPDDPRYSFGFLLEKLETLTKALVRHLLVHYVTPAAVQSSCGTPALDATVRREYLRSIPLARRVRRADPECAPAVRPRAA